MMIVLLLLLLLMLTTTMMMMFVCFRDCLKSYRINLKVGTVSTPLCHVSNRHSIVVSSVDTVSPSPNSLHLIPG